jgi:DNA-binding NarL/FixJ family response regulator
LASVRILIVDDSQEWRQAICLILKRHLTSATISESADGLDAVRRSKEWQPDLILLDIRLPNLNGLQAARLIRRLAPDSRILFLSSYDRQELLHEAVDIGALGMIAKSQAARHLLPAITTVLRDEQYFVGGFNISFPPDTPDT